MEPLIILLLIVAVPAAFALSASAGLGGSLIMAPALMLAFGPKQGVALAALLLAANNVFKVWSYRDTIPWRPSLGIVGAVMAGNLVGAGLLIAAPETWVALAVIAAFSATLVFDLVPEGPARRSRAALLAFGSGATSGFSGTSGPLKGVAIRSLNVERMWFVGAASLVSLAGDATKAALFSKAGLLSASHWLLAAALIPVMFVATHLGKRINSRVGERGYAVLFWAVMAGYTVRLLTWA